ncbi:MAG TPA: hypothetical protein VLL52_25570, partial [Anaerolineae bacterium]|nr:hypothetical protein [Anaerolineae bacterium]
VAVFVVGVGIVWGVTDLLGEMLGFWVSGWLGVVVPVVLLVVMSGWHEVGVVGLVVLGWLVGFGDVKGRSGGMILVVLGVVLGLEGEWVGLGVWLVAGWVGMTHLLFYGLYTGYHLIGERVGRAERWVAWSPLWWDELLLWPVPGVGGLIGRAYEGDKEGVRACVLHLWRYEGQRAVGQRGRLLLLAADLAEVSDVVEIGRVGSEWAWLFRGVGRGVLRDGRRVVRVLAEVRDLVGVGEVAAGRVRLAGMWAEVGEVDEAVRAWFEPVVARWEMILGRELL